MNSILVCAILCMRRPISFHMSCLGALLLVVIVAVLSPDNHIGTRLLGAASLLGSMAWGLMLGGALVSKLLGKRSFIVCLYTSWFTDCFIGERGLA